MSTDIGTIELAGSKMEDIKITRYWGAAKGLCYQLTQTMEGDACKRGYVQLSYSEILELLKIINNNMVCDL